MNLGKSPCCRPSYLTVLGSIQRTLQVLADGQCLFARSTSAYLLVEPVVTVEYWTYLPTHLPTYLPKLTLDSSLGC